MAKFRISTHGRLQDWIAVEKGYFEDEGLDYVIDMRVLENADQDIAAPALSDVRTGAYELYQGESGGKQNMSCACHWQPTKLLPIRPDECGVARTLSFRVASTLPRIRKSVSRGSCGD